MDGNGETTTFYVMIWKIYNHPIETTIYKPDVSASKRDLYIIYLHLLSTRSTHPCIGKQFYR